MAAAPHGSLTAPGEPHFPDWLFVLSPAAGFAVRPSETPPGPASAGKPGVAKARASLLPWMKAKVACEGGALCEASLEVGADGRREGPPQVPLQQHSLACEAWAWAAEPQRDCEHCHKGKEKARKRLRAGATLGAED